MLEVDVLVRHRAHHVRAGDEHVAGALHHQGEVGDGRRVHGAARAGAHDQRDLGDDAGRQDVAQEDVGIAAERDDALLDARAAGVVEADDRRADLHRQVHDLADLLGVGLAERAAEDGEVLAEDEDQAAVDGAVPGDDAVAEDALLVEPEVVGAVRHEARRTRRSCPRRAAAPGAHARSACPSHAASRCAPRRRRGAIAPADRAGARSAPGCRSLGVSLPVLAWPPRWSVRESYCPRGGAACLGRDAAPPGRSRAAVSTRLPVSLRVFTLAGRPWCADAPFGRLRQAGCCHRQGCAPSGGRLGTDHLDRQPEGRRGQDDHVDQPGRCARRARSPGAVRGHGSAGQPHRRPRPQRA